MHENETPEEKIWFEAAPGVPPSRSLVPITPAAANSDEIFSFEEEYTEIVELNGDLAMERKAQSIGRFTALVLTTPVVYLYMVPVAMVIGTLTTGVIISKSFIKSFVVSCFEFLVDLTDDYKYPKWMVAPMYRFSTSCDNLVNSIKKFCRRSR